MHTDVSTLDNTLYDFARLRRACGGDAKVGRWERLLKGGVEERVLRAIDWSGKLSDEIGRAHSSPPHNEFKQHFEKLLNETRVVNLSL